MLYQGLNVPVYSESTYETQDTTIPCIVFYREGTTGVQTMNGAGLLTDSVTFSAKGKYIDDVERLRDYIISSLNGYCQEVQIAITGETDDFDAINQIYSRDITFDVMYGTNYTGITGSFGGGTITTASYAFTASYAQNFNPGATASYALSALVAATSATSSIVTGKQIGRASCRERVFRAV